MQYNPEIHRRKSIRLKGYDYSKQGAYFITIGTRNRICLFGKIEDEKMVLNEYGTISTDYLQGIPKNFPNVLLREYIVMPNHIHAIIIITGSTVGAIHELPNTPNNSAVIGTIHESSSTKDEHLSVETIHESSLQPNDHIIQRTIRESSLQLTLRNQRRKMLLSKIAGRYKMKTAKEINLIAHREGTSLWQSRFYDHIIRDEASYQKIAEYTITNPKNGRKINFICHGNQI